MVKTFQLMSLGDKFVQSKDACKFDIIHSKITSLSNFGSQNQPILNFSPSLILRNTQYLTNLQNYLNTKLSFTEVQIENFYGAIDPGSFCRIIVQNMYLLQICYLFRVKVYLSLNFYVEKAKHTTNLHNVNIFQLYCFQNQLTQKSQGQKYKFEILSAKFIKLFSDQTDNKIQDFFFILERLVKNLNVYLRCLQKSQKNSPSNNTEMQQNIKFLTEFVNIYESIIYQQKHRIPQPKTLIKFLEQTKIFRSHSLLVKIVNSTLFYSIKLFRKQLLEQIKLSTTQIQKFFLHDVPQVAFQKPVIKIIDHFFTYLCRSDVIEITKSLKGMQDTQQTAGKDALSLFDYADAQILVNPTITASIFVPEQKYPLMTPQLFERILENNHLSNFELDQDFVLPQNFQIQISYTYAMNIIKIVCITDIDIGIDNMDYLNYLIAAFNQGMKSTLMVDTVQKFRKSMTKKIQKVIAFKLTYKPRHNQEPLTKILELIDVGILASKIFTIELRKKSFIKLQQYQKRQRVCEMFGHYENILRNAIRKFYSDLKGKNQII